MAPALDCSLEQWRSIVDIDLTGVWITVKTTVAALRAAGGGTIIVMGSGAGRANAGGLGPYSAAKAGVTALVPRARGRAARRQHRGQRADPGPVRTPALDIFSGAGRGGTRTTGARHRRVAQGARGRGRGSRSTSPPCRPTEPPARSSASPGACSENYRAAMLAVACPPSHRSSTVAGGSTSRRT